MPGSVKVPGYGPTAAPVAKYSTVDVSAGVAPQCTVTVLASGAVLRVSPVMVTVAALAGPARARYIAARVSAPATRTARNIVVSLRRCVCSLGSTVCCLGWIRWAQGPRGRPGVTTRALAILGPNGPAQASGRRLGDRPGLPLRLHPGLVADLEGPLRGRGGSHRHALPRAGDRIALVADGAQSALPRS